MRIQPIQAIEVIAKLGNIVTASANCITLNYGVFSFKLECRPQHFQPLLNLGFKIDFSNISKASRRNGNTSIIEVTTRSINALLALEIWLRFNHQTTKLSISNDFSCKRDFSNPYPPLVTSEKIADFNQRILALKKQYRRKRNDLRLPISHKALTLNLT